MYICKVNTIRIFFSLSFCVFVFVSLTNSRKAVPEEPAGVRISRIRWAGRLYYECHKSRDALRLENVEQFQVHSNNQINTYYIDVHAPHATVQQYTTLTSIRMGIGVEQLF